MLLVTPNKSKHPPRKSSIKQDSVGRFVFCLSALVSGIFKEEFTNKEQEGFKMNSVLLQNPKGKTTQQREMCAISVAFDSTYKLLFCVLLMLPENE